MVDPPDSQWRKDILTAAGKLQPTAVFSFVIDWPENIDSGLFYSEQLVGYT